MNKQPSLIFCLLMDLIGYASFSVPLLGEFSDLLWAPLSAMIFYRSFGGWKGALGGLFNFAEELLPFSDFVPSFTLAWMWQAWKKRKSNVLSMPNLSSKSF